jgi:hypothetical protein
MNFNTISALVLRYLFLYTRSPMRLVELVFWPLVDQQNDQITFRMICGDRLRNILQQNSFTRSGRSHDQAALPLADG